VIVDDENPHDANVPPKAEPNLNELMQLPLRPRKCPSQLTGSV